MLPSQIELIYFYEVASTLSFSRAALKLKVSQPSLSLAIKRLEELLEKRLFIRHKKGVTLTRAGEILFKDVVCLLDKWSQTKKNVQIGHEDVEGKIILGCHSTLAPFISHLISSLLTKFPSLEVHLQHALTPEILDGIAHGHIDIGIVINPNLRPEIILSQISEVEFTFWTANNPSVPVNLFTDKTTIFCDLNLSQTQYLLKILQDRNPNLRINTANQLEIIATMTASDCGVGILPTCFVELMFANRLTRVEGAPSYFNPLCLAYNFQNKEVGVVQKIWAELKIFCQQQLNERSTKSHYSIGNS